MTHKATAGVASWRSRLRGVGQGGPRRVTLVLLLLTTLPGWATAQSLQFVNARYASSSSLALYAGYDAGPGLVFVGLSHNPRSAFRNALVGVGKPLGNARRSVLLAAAAGTTNEGALAQLYMIPAVSLGEVTVDALATLQKAFEGRPTKLSIAPAKILIDAGERWQVGASWVLSVTFGQGHEQALGPTVVRLLPGAALGVHLLSGFGRRPGEFWLTATLTP